jgi:hypothetical protein
MKKYSVLILVSIFTFFFGINITRADDSISPVNNIAPTETVKTADEVATSRASAEQKMQDLKDSISNEKNQSKAKLEMDRITGREEALKKFDGAVKKISDLDEKVNTEINNMEAQGVNVIEAKNLIAIAESNLNEANEQIAETEDLFSNSANELGVADKDNLKTLAGNIQNLVTESYQTLGNAIGALENTIQTKTAENETGTGNQ